MYQQFHNHFQFTSDGNPILEGFNFAALILVIFKELQMLPIDPCSLPTYDGGSLLQLNHYYSLKLQASRKEISFPK